MTTSKDSPKPPSPKDIKPREVKKPQGGTTGQTTTSSEERKARRAAQNNPAAQRAFGELHATLAEEHPAITTLETDSPEREIAIAAIKLYPSVTRTSSRGRCDVAIRTAVETIPELRKYADEKDLIGRVATAVKRAFGTTLLRAKAKDEALRRP